MFGAETMRKRQGHARAIGMLFMFEWLLALPDTKFCIVIISKYLQP